MDLASLLLLLMMGGLGWFWFNSMNALEVARNAGRQVCSRANVQFLDDTVSSIGLALVRNQYGRRVLRRTYRFEFTETGNSRLEGRLVVLDNKIESVTMEPYQITPQSDAPGADNCSNSFADSAGSYGGCCGGGCSSGTMQSLPAADRDDGSAKRES